MDFAQTVTLAIAGSGPIAISVGIVRSIMCLDRSVRGKRTKSAVLAGLAILVLVLLLAAMLVVWFGYGVAHTGKDTTTDLAVLAGTVIPAYIGVYAAWRLSAYLESGLHHRTR